MSPDFARAARARKLAAACGAASIVGLPAGLMVASAAGGAPPAPGAAAAPQLRTIFSGATLGVSQPDDVAMLDGTLFVDFQNGVGPQGQPSPTGVTTSTVVAMTTDGLVRGTWQLTGHCDGLTADPAAHQLVATVNEDANSSVYTIDPGSSTPDRYTYSPTPLPHGGGTDAISVVDGKLLVSASAPGTTSSPTAYPAVYMVRLDATSHVATATPLFSAQAQATVANAGPAQGSTVSLNLTDPDSNEVVPPTSPRFAGDFVLDSQGDQQQVYVAHPGTSAQSLSVLNLSQSVNDTAWAMGSQGALYLTDHADNLVDVMSGPFAPGTAFVAATPCDANGASSTCAANYLGALDLQTGTVSPVDLGGEQVQPQGLLFVGRGDGRGDGWPGHGSSGPSDEPGPAGGWAR